MLLWNCCNEIIPVAQKLPSIVESISPICVRCYTSENHLHLFRDCWESSIIWNYIFERTKVATVINLHLFFNASWRDWITYNLNQNRAWKVMFITSIWHVWIARNKTVFELKVSKPFSIYNALFIDHASISYILQVKETPVIRAPKPTWYPPTYDYLKLNVDGSWKDLNEAGGGGVFRGVSGNWYMGFSSKYDASLPLAAELYAIREGLTMAVDYDIQNLELETDATILIKLLHNLDDTYHHELSPVINDVACLMSRFRSIEFTYIPRSTNKVAHCLAQYSFAMEVGHNMFLNPPPFARVAYEGDLEGLKAIPDLNKTMEQGTQEVGESSAVATSTDASAIVSTQILFGTIPTTVTTSVAKLKK
ncbi:uncharacterized protein [Spinacia oleracea]|uniref:RNase H type-1 domain-containing protein n=1 Tax=Spinacia oleracea TaxID=3562 RepID=A0ABM3RJ82_SPIOL|nr:uncharacterized protein LOC130470113 [Spinacia oleracea]